MALWKKIYLHTHTKKKTVLPTWFNFFNLKKNNNNNNSKVSTAINSANGCFKDLEKIEQ